MEKTGKHKKRFGLVGRQISYSFSKGYFTKKFEVLGLTGHSYENFDIDEISEIEEIFALNDLGGVNVTIPYKQKIIPYLSEIDAAAAQIGAVNTIKFTPNGPKGYNTDVHGFKTSLLSKLKPHHKKALVLGTGGASKAIAHVLGELDIDHTFVSRKPQDGQLAYAMLDHAMITAHTLIINCTPLGTYPKVGECPALPYSLLTKAHFLFDLIYNPKKTTFLQEGEARGASIQNGLPMLEGQAEKAWEIWRE